jgi:hypothetical protein
LVVPTSGFEKLGLELDNAGRTVKINHRRKYLRCVGVDRVKIRNKIKVIKEKDLTIHAGQFY